MSFTFMAAISVAISTDIWIAYNSDPAPGQPVKEEVGDSGKEGGSKFKNADYHQNIKIRHLHRSCNIGI